VSEIHRQRIETLRQRLMEPLGLDLVVAYADDPHFAGAVRYIADFDVYAMYAVAIVPRRGDVVLAFGLHHSAYLVRVKEAAIADYYVGTRHPGAVCAGLLAEMNLARRPRVGLVGATRMFAAIDRDLRHSLAQAEMRDVDEAFAEIAAPLDRAASVALRRGAAAVVHAQAAASRLFHRGAALGEIVAEAADMTRRRGVDSLNRELVTIRAAAGDRLPETLGPGAGSGTLPGPIAAIEIAAPYRGLHACATRTLVAAAAPPAWQASVARVNEAHAAIIARLRAGMTGADMHRTAAEALARFGFATKATEFGHAIGFAARATPHISAAETRAAGAGSAVVLRLAPIVEPIGAVHVADTLILAAGGSEAITAAA
jgi:Xaa-Pro aminopeptidase